MATFARCTFALAAIFFLSCLFCEEVKHGNILYAMQAGDPSKSLELYKSYVKAEGHHDFDLLQQMAILLLEQGSRDRDPETQLLTLFGAGISANEKMINILENGLDSPNPQLQLVAINFLARFQNDRADMAMNRAMSSNCLPIRLETAYLLAQKKYPTAFGQTEALMQKLDKRVWFVFPQFFAMIGDRQSIKTLRQLMSHSGDDVRIEAILSAAKHGRDDLLPQIRKMASHLNIGQQEACAAALGIMKDEASVEKLKLLANSASSHVSLASCIALYNLGRKEYKAKIEECAKSDDIFAIAALGSISGSEEVLVELIKSSNLQTRINATMSLLELRDSRCVNGLGEILAHDHRDLGFIKATSPGKGLSAWKAIPSAHQNFKENPLSYEMSISMREAVLVKTLELPEKDFILIAHALFEIQQNELVPTLVHLLENLRTKSAIDLLKKHQQKIGAPLIRNYCNLALYKLKEEGPYSENLCKWVTKQQHIELIQFRPMLTWEMRFEESHYQLTAKETSQLLIESVEALAQAQDDTSLDALIEIIQNGNAKNKYALAGLLIRAIQ